MYYLRVFAIATTLFILGASLGIEPFANADASCSHLSSLLLSEKAQYSEDALEMAALNSNETCIDTLWPARERGIAQRYGLAKVLEIIGGPVAVARLQVLVTHWNDEYLRCCLYSAMISTGSPADIRRLLDSLHGYSKKDLLDQSPDCAADALSVLRPVDALPDVLQVLGANPDAQSLINLARVYKEGELSTPQAGTLAAADEVVLAILKSNPPGTMKNSLYRDPLRQRIYRRSRNKWFVKPSRVWEAGDRTKAAFRVRLSNDETRALVDLMYASSSYTYVLRREGGRWRIRAFRVGPFA